MAGKRNISPMAAVAASPTMVGAITTLIVVVAVFLAYNANNGLPFVPVYRVSVVVPNAARLTPNNEVRIGGSRVGVIESIDAVRLSDDGDGPETTPVPTTGNTDGVVARAEPEDRRVGLADPRQLDLPDPLSLGVRPQVPRHHPRRRARGTPGLHLQRHQRQRRSRRRRQRDPLDRRGREESGRRRRHVHRPDRVRRDRQHLRSGDPERDPPEPGRLRRRVHRPRGLPEPGVRGAQPVAHQPAPGRADAQRPADQPGRLLPGAGPDRRDRRPGRRAERRAVRQRGDDTGRDRCRSDCPAGDDLRRSAGPADGHRRAARPAPVPARHGRAREPPAPGGSATAARIAEPQRRDQGRDAGARPQRRHEPAVEGRLHAARGPGRAAGDEELAGPASGPVRQRQAARQVRRARRRPSATTGTTSGRCSPST